MFIAQVFALPSPPCSFKDGAMSLSTTLKHLRHRRPRLLGALLAGLIVYLLLPGAMALPVRFIIAWDFGIVLFLVLILVMMTRSDAQKLRFRAQLEDERAWAILALMVGAALASMLAIGFVLHQAKDMHGWIATLYVSLAGLTILLSWLMAHTMFALHFAHAYYGDRRGIGSGDKARPSAKIGTEGVAGGLAFPGEDSPDYWDFLYFSLVIGMTCQVSDVQVTSRRMRRLALAHGLIAFLFNTVVLALCINLLAGLL